ncbi:MAG: hypothetical protein AAFV43_03530 [Planctomycetota bacterium]
MAITDYAAARTHVQRLLFEDLGTFDLAIDLPLSRAFGVMAEKLCRAACREGITPDEIEAVEHADDALDLLRKLTPLPMPLSDRLTWIEC